MYWRRWIVIWTISKLLLFSFFFFKKTVNGVKEWEMRELTHSFLLFILSWTCKSRKEFESSLPFLLFFIICSLCFIYLFLFCFLLFNYLLFIIYYFHFLLFFYQLPPFSFLKFFSLMEKFNVCFFINYYYYLRKTKKYILYYYSFFIYFLFLLHFNLKDYPDKIGCWELSLFT